MEVTTRRRKAKDVEGNGLASNGQSNGGSNGHSNGGSNGHANGGSHGMGELSKAKRARYSSGDIPKPLDKSEKRDLPLNNNNNNNNSNNNKNNKNNNMSWGYGAKDGPNTWAANFPDANGPRQSPVDIVPKEATYEKSLSDAPLTISYSAEPDLELENPGLSFKVNIKADSIISGGPLNDAKYKLVQFHFHWGHDDNSGSEHTVNGKMYPSELHLVHYNTEKYASFGEAVTHSDGLSVIGIFIRVGDSEHKGFQTLAENAGKVKCKATKVSTGVTFNPASLLPNNTSKYWTYEGSLTTPPCCESVRWIVLKEEISISPDQLQAMRDLCCDDCGAIPIPANFRPPLPLGSRDVQASFQ